MSVTAGVRDAALAVRDKLRGKIRQTKVKRYWPGKAPEWADNGYEEAFPLHHQHCAVVTKDDPRLRRLAKIEEVKADHRRTRQAEIISTDMEEEEEEDEDALEERRRRIKENFRLREEETALPPEEDEEEEEEYETDSEKERKGVAMLNPIFVPKSQRETAAEAEERDLQEKERSRKLETKRILVDEIQKNLSISNVVDTEDEEVVNEEKEYEKWKGREIERMKRAMLKDKVRNITEEKRNPKQKWRFMQKYYHEVSFFQDEGDEQKHDFSAPTGEDKMDKSMLPKMMQVKHFGRRGRTKWTHLVNEDTTDWNDPWTDGDALCLKYNKPKEGLENAIGLFWIKRLVNY